MDFEELFIWLESFAGVPFDFREDLNTLSQYDAFVDPFDWRVSLANIFTNLDNALDIIDEHKRDMPDTFPPYADVKRELTRSTISIIFDNVKQTLSMIGVDMDDVNSLDDLKASILAASELIEMCIKNDLDMIKKDNLYEAHEDDSDNSFAKVLDVHERDLNQMYEIITSLHYQAQMMLDDEDE